MGRPVTLVQQYSAGSYNSYSVEYGNKGGLHRGLPEAREEALEIARRYHTTVSETLLDWRSA
jgi:hypothetical protein